MRVSPLQDLSVFLLQFRRLFEASVRAEVVLEKTIDCAGNVPTHRVESFVLAPVAVGGTSVDEQHFGCAQMMLHVVSIDLHAILQLEGEGRSMGFRRLGAEGMTARHPGLQPAVEHRHLAVPQPAQQPPQARRKHASCIIVGNHLGLVANTEAAELVGQQAWCGQWMAPVAARDRA